MGNDTCVKTCSKKNHKVLKDVLRVSEKNSNNNRSSDSLITPREAKKLAKEIIKYVDNDTDDSSSDSDD